MSWGYQQLNRLLFGLDVADTQVGMKVFSRAVVDDVVPLLVVKRFAFDLELLAVANAVGHGRVRELPVRLEYRFSGSGVGWRAVARALIDTAAVFYRLRLLRTYQRKRACSAMRRRGACGRRCRSSATRRGPPRWTIPRSSCEESPTAELVAVAGAPAGVPAATGSPRPCRSSRGRTWRPSSCRA